MTLYFLFWFLVTAGGFAWLTIIKRNRIIFAKSASDMWQSDREKVFKKLRNKWFKPLYFPWAVWEIANIAKNKTFATPDHQGKHFRREIISLTHSYSLFLEALEKNKYIPNTLLSFNELKYGTLVRYISPVDWQHEDFDNYVRMGGRPGRSEEYFVPNNGHHWIVRCKPNFNDHGLPTAATIYSIIHGGSPHHDMRYDAYRTEMKIGTIGLYLGKILVKWRGLYENKDNLNEECGIVLFGDKYYLVSQECIELAQ